jgi:hypothetical protein
VALAALALLASAVAGAAEPVDVTDAVRGRPDLLAALERGCAQVCQGNRREARLERVTALSLGGGRWRVEGLAALRNRHVQSVPAGLGGLSGGSLTLFDHTVRVRARGTLDRRSCQLVVEGVELDRDPLGLSRLLAGEVGRRHRVARCDELLPPEPSSPAGRPPSRP